MTNVSFCHMPLRPAIIREYPGAGPYGQISSVNSVSLRSCGFLRRGICDLVEVAVPVCGAARHPGDGAIFAGAAAGRIIQGLLLQELQLVGRVFSGGCP